jgi:hypothetical protein
MRRGSAQPVECLEHIRAVAGMSYLTHHNMSPKQQQERVMLLRQGDKR